MDAPTRVEMYWMTNQIADGPGMGCIQPLYICSSTAMDKLDLRQRLLLQREYKRQEELLSRQNAIQAAQDLAFLGVPFKEICKGANIDSSQLKAFYHECGLPTSYSKKRRGEFTAADDDSRDIRTLAAIVSTNDLVHRLPQYNGTQFGRNRWSRLVEIENEDYEPKSQKNTEKSKSSEMKLVSKLSSAISRPDLLKAIQDQIEATKKLSQGLSLKSKPSPSTPAQNKEERMISIVTGQNLGSIPWAASSHATEQEVKAMDNYESTLVNKIPSVEPDLSKEGSPPLSLAQPGSITKIPLSKNWKMSSPQTPNHTPSIPLSRSAGASTDTEHIMKEPSLPSKRPAPEPDTANVSRKKNVVENNSKNHTVRISDYVPPDEKSSLFVGKQVSDPDLDDATDISTGRFALYTAPEKLESFYESPLQCFWTNRFSPFFLKGDTRRVFSPSYNSALVRDAANREWCPNDLDGKTCSKKDCPKVHFDDWNVDQQAALKSVVQQGTQDKKVKQDFALALGEQKAKHGSKMEPVQVVDLLLKVMRSDENQWY